MMAKGHLTTKCHMWPLYFQLSEREFLEISHQFLSLKKKTKTQTSTAGVTLWD